MKVFRLILIVFTLGIFSSGCAKEEPVPDLPPQASFIMEIDNIWKEGPLPGSFPAGVNRSNFLFAATNIYWWNTVLSVQMAIPAAAFLESFNHDPVWDKTSREWIWSYTVDFLAVSYIAELHGDPSGEEVKWSMYVTKTDAYTDFLWFTGISKTDNSSGSWSLNKDPEGIQKDPQESKPFIEINWEINDDGSSEISYTNIEEGSTSKGSYIKYGKINDPDLDAYYDVFKVWEDDLVNIKWNTTSHYGRVLSMVHFQDPYWHCWTEALENTACD